MNKIKLLHDITKTMKEKELFNGTLQVDCAKDQVTVFQMDNSFTKNLSTGLTKANIKTDMNYEGKSFKHESSTEFTHPEGFKVHCHSHGHFFKRKHPHFDQPLPCGHEHGGLRGIFSMLSFALDILNRTEVEEQADQSYRITLTMDELPKNLPTKFSHRFNDQSGKHSEYSEFHKHCLMQEFHDLENPSLTLVALVNKDYAVECINIIFSGTKVDENKENHTLKLKADLTLAD